MPMIYYCTLCNHITSRIICQAIRGIFLKILAIERKEGIFLAKFTIESQHIAVSMHFIRDIMPQANGTYVKVYLYALSLAQTGTEMSNSDIAKALGILESDVVQAFTYWYQNGVLVIRDGVVEFSGFIQKPDLPKSAVTEQVSYPIEHVTSAISSNEALSDMYTLAQGVLDKTLTTSEIQTLYWIYDDLKFSPEAVLMLLEYCVSKNKRNMKYIEQVAISWAEKGIVTMEAIDRYVKQEQEHSGYIHTLRKAFGIADRKASRMEDEMMARWRDEYHMSEEMAALAYEYCIMQTSKLSLPYIDKILERWANNGIRTIDAAERDNEQFRRANTHSANNNGTYQVYEDHYNHDELEDIIRKKLESEQ